MFFSDKKRLDDLGDRVETLERKMKALVMEWDDVLDRVRRRTANAVRAARRLEELESPPDSSQVEAGVSGTVPGLDPISARILARRKHMAAPEEVEQ